MWDEHLGLLEQQMQLVFASLLDGKVADPVEVANILSDPGHRAIGSGLGQAIWDFCASGRPLRATFARELGAIMDIAVVSAFGTTRRALIAPWYFRSLTWVLIWTSSYILQKANRDLDTGGRVSREAWRVLLSVAEALRAYLPLDAAAEADSCGVHAFLFALLPPFVSPYDPDLVIVAMSELSPAHAVLMEVVAEAVLETKCRSVVSWNRAFGYFFGSCHWQAFLEGCIATGEWSLYHSERLRDAMATASMSTAYSSPCTPPRDDGLPSMSFVDTLCNDERLADCVLDVCTSVNGHETFFQKVKELVGTPSAAPPPKPPRASVGEKRVHELVAVRAQLPNSHIKKQRREKMLSKIKMFDNEMLSASQSETFVKPKKLDFAGAA